MKLHYYYTLLTLLFVLHLATANAQTKRTVRKAPAISHAKHIVKKAHAKKAVAKKVAPKKVIATKTPVKPIVKPTAATRKTIEAKNLGDAVNKAANDTTKKGADNNQGELSEEIIVTTAYKPVLADAVKIRRNPDLEDKIPFKAPLNYTTLDKRLTKDEDIKQLSAMKIPAEKDSALTNNYLKVGAGNFKTTYGEFYINNGKDEALQAGGYLKHFAQDGNIYKQDESKDAIGVFGKSITNTNALSGRIDYSYNTNYFYGYDPSYPPAKFNPAEQHFSLISAEGEIAKNYQDVDNAFTYALKLKGYAFSNAFHAQENNIVLSGFLNETVKHFYAGISASADLSTQNDSLYSYNNSLLRANPYLKFQGNSYKIDAGINIVDQFGFSSNFYIFPAAKLELQVIPKYVRLFAEVRGDVNKTSLLDLANKNPFLGQNVPIKNSVDKLDISAGLKGTLAPGLSFKADVYRNSIKDMPLLVSNFTTEVNKFTVVYDNGNSTVNGFNGEIDFKPADELDLFGKVDFKNYQMASQAEAWNLPKFKLTAGGVINISNRVKLTGSMLIRGSAYDRVFNPTQSIVNIKSFADLSGGVEYRVNKKFYIFGQVNNILNTKNQTWLYYPDYGFNIFGGLGFSF